MWYFGYRLFLVGCTRATNQISKVENQIRKSLGLLILTAFRSNENLSDDDSHVSSPVYTRILLDLLSIAQTVSDHASRAIDGLSAAASIIAIIQISEDVISLCY
jgi:hypothetical protein